MPGREQLREHEDKVMQTSMIPEYVKPVAGAIRPPSLERMQFVNGMLDSLNEALQRHLALVSELSNLQAKIDVSEKSMVAIRDYVRVILDSTREESLPHGWEDALKQVRFVGARLGSACVELLEEESPLTTEELRERLDDGQFRFRSGTPLREINAALIRNARAHRDGDRWFHVADEDSDIEAIAS